MNKQQLASKIWSAANGMRSKIEASEYKDYILGFIFYKYLSDYEERYLREQGFEQSDIEALAETDEDTLEFVRRNIGYFISYKNLFSTWIKMGSDFDISNVSDALSAFSRLIDVNRKKLFKDIFKTLETGLSKLGENSASQTKSASDLIFLINDIPMNGQQDYDVLGFIYEYLISMFAANAGKKAGEFYTPHEVSMLMSEIIAHHLKDREQIRIYDPTSGSGSLLINIGRSISKYTGNADNILYYAQELKQNTYNLTRMNLIMRGINSSNIFTRNADTLEDDWPFFDESDPSNTYELLPVDAVVSNPPYSQPWDPSDKEGDPRYNGFGLAPKSKADYAFLLHDLYHLKDDGIMTIVLPHGVLFRGGEEGAIRQALVERNHIDAIIGLPANIFFGTGIPTIIMVLRKKRANTDTLIIDASKGFIKVGKNNKLQASDIKRIADTYINRGNVEKFAKRVSREEIRQNDYNLNIPRYVDSSEKAESWDIYASMFGGIPKSEVEELKAYWSAFPELKESLFKNKNEEYFELKVEDVHACIFEKTSSFVEGYQKAFEDFPGKMKEMLIDTLDEVNELEIPKQEGVLSEDLFLRMANVPLIDKYDVYQLLDNDWTKISNDLETIQTEGVEACKKVDTLTEEKKGKTVVVGHVGHVLPFELVQKVLLSGDVAEIAEVQSRIEENVSKQEEIVSNLSEEDKELFTSFLSDNEEEEDEGEFKLSAGDAKSLLKALKADPDYKEQAKVIGGYSALAEELKVLKKDLSTKQNALELKTIDTIEKLTDDEVKVLLQEKWISPLTEQIAKLPQTELMNLEHKVKALAEKYKETYADNEEEIGKVEGELTKLIDELEGSAFDEQGLKELQSFLKGE